MVGASHYGSVAVNDFAPLQRIASKFGSSLLAGIVSIGAVTAMLGVLLNLILGSAYCLRWAAKERAIPIRTHCGTCAASATICAGIIIAAIALAGHQNDMDIRRLHRFDPLRFDQLCAIKLSG